MKRGRPKGRSSDQRSYGPLGDLIRSNRLEKGLGLLDIAKACQCSVQFVSNIEHGRAPLPWEKVPLMASFLKIRLEDLQAANLAIRSDFKNFVGGDKVARNTNGLPKSSGKVTGTASAVAAAATAAKDAKLREVIQRYQTATPQSRKRFVRAALEIL